MNFLLLYLVINDLFFVLLCSDLLRFLNIISSFFHSIWHAVISLLAIRNFGGLPIYSWSHHKELWFIFRHSCFELFLYYLCSIQCENTKLENYGSNSIKQGQSHQIMKKNSFQYKKPQLCIRPVLFHCNLRSLSITTLKVQCHEIFELNFFSLIKPIWAPDKPAKNLFSRRYSNLNLEKFDSAQANTARSRNFWQASPLKS